MSSAWPVGELERRVAERARERRAQPPRLDRPPQLDQQLGHARAREPGAQQARQEGGRDRGEHADLRDEERPRLVRHAVLWRDLVAARPAPSRVAEAVAVTAAGTALAVLDTDRPVAVLAAVALVYCGAARLPWPLRGEL